jgi:RHS repeat-associated protein
VNLLNQLTGKVNPSAADVLGAANAQAEVRVNGLPTYRRGEYFHRELAVTNASSPAWTPVSVSAMQSGSTNTTGGNLHSPPVNETLVYDADGNLLHDGLWVYQWDAENRLLSVTSTNIVPSSGRRQVRWAYDAGGRRVRQTQAIWSGSSYTNAVDQKLIHDGWACVAELNSANSLQRQYVWGLDLSGTMTGAGGVGGLLWMLPSGGAARFAAYDGNGNVMGLVQDNGQFKAWYEYDPFGRTIRETTEDATTAQNPYKFSTKRAEPYTGLILYEYRAYDAKAGRWLSRDPIGERGGLNLYGFIRNVPVSEIDVLGLNDAIYFWLEDTVHFPTDGPGVWDALNPGGIRRNTGTENYTDYFNRRFPETIDNAKRILEGRIKNKACAQIDSEPNRIPDLIDKDNDVDVTQTNGRILDKPQDWWERNVVLGDFEVKANDIRITNWRWGRCSKCFDYEASIYVLEQSGTKWGEKNGILEPLAGKRYVKMADWKVSGSHCCDLTP